MLDQTSYKTVDKTLEEPYATHSDAENEDTPNVTRRQQPDEQ